MGFDSAPYTNSFLKKDVLSLKSQTERYSFIQVPPPMEEYAGAIRMRMLLTMTGAKE